MSRMATNEYIDAKRMVYALADRVKRTRILDEVARRPATNGNTRTVY